MPNCEAAWRLRLRGQLAEMYAAFHAAFPLIRFAMLSTFPLPGEGFYCPAFSSCLANLTNYRTQPRLIPAPNHPPWHADRRSARACAARPRGKAGSERRKACFHPGGSGFHLPRGGQGHTQFYSIDFYVARSLLWYFLGLQESTVFLVPLVPPRPPRPLTSGSCGCTWQFASFFHAWRPAAPRGRTPLSAPDSAAIAPRPACRLPARRARHSPARLHVCSF